MTAIPGRVFLTPTSALVGGTLLPDLRERRVIWDDGRRTQLVRSGFAVDAFDVIGGRSEAPSLRLEPRGDDATTLLRLFVMTAGGVASSGGTVLDDFALHAEWSLVVRPLDATATLLYGPAWKLHPDTRGRIVWHPTEPSLEESFMLLVPTKDPDSDVPAWKRDTAAAIDEVYFGD